MFFGQDQDALARQRAAANRKYAEDLRQQIAEQKQRDHNTVNFAPGKIRHLAVRRL
jgi:hypothetical protein